jgi:lysozyme
MADYIKFVDISSLQGIIDFNALRQQGIDGVIIKSYQGNDGQDTHYALNVEKATIAGLKIAIYNFIYPLQTDPDHPNRDPVSQATLHFNASKGQPVVCVDCEWPAPQDFASWQITPAFIRQWILTYLQTYTELSGRKPLVYVYPDWAQAVGMAEEPEFANYDLWIASYDDSEPLIPAPWTTWKIWQNSGGKTYHLPNGIPCDTDVVKDLSLWDAVPAQPVVIAAPQPAPEAPPAPAVVPVAPAPEPVVAPQNPSTSFWSSILKFWENLF